MHVGLFMSRKNGGKVEKTSNGELQNALKKVKKLRGINSVILLLICSPRFVKVKYIVYCSMYLRVLTISALHKWCLCKCWYIRIAQLHVLVVLTCGSRFVGHTVLRITHTFLPTRVEPRLVLYIHDLTQTPPPNQTIRYL